MADSRRQGEDLSLSTASAARAITVDSARNHAGNDRRMTGEFPGQERRPERRDSNPRQEESRQRIPHDTPPYSHQGRQGHHREHGGRPHDQGYNVQHQHQQYQQQQYRQSPHQWQQHGQRQQYDPAAAAASSADYRSYRSSGSSTYPGPPAHRDHSSSGGASRDRGPHPPRFAPFPCGSEVTLHVLCIFSVGYKVGHHACASWHLVPGQLHN